MDPLTAMHLLLREHGWEPEVATSGNWWNWTLGGCPVVIETYGTGESVAWAEETQFVGGVLVAKSTHRTVAGLRRRLQELAEQLAQQHA